MKISCATYTYLLEKFERPIVWILIIQFQKQKRKVSSDLEKFVYKAVEIPWSTPPVEDQVKIQHF